MSSLAIQFPKEQPIQRRASFNALTAKQSIKGIFMAALASKKSTAVGHEIKINSIKVE
jgi:hypothetical protein